jgi:hypothetical protein
MFTQERLMDSNMEKIMVMIMVAITPLLANAPPGEGTVGDDAGHGQE